MVAFGGDEDLSLVLQPAEGFRVQNPVAVTLEAGADRVQFLENFPALRVGRAAGVLTQGVFLALFDAGSNESGLHGIRTDRANRVPQGFSPTFFNLEDKNEPQPRSGWGSVGLANRN